MEFRCQEVAAQTHQGLCLGVCVREEPRSRRHRILEFPTLLPTPNPALRTLKAVSACRWASRVGPAGTAPVRRSLLPELCSAPRARHGSPGRPRPSICFGRACSSHTPTALGHSSKAHSFRMGVGGVASQIQIWAARSGQLHHANIKDPAPWLEYWGFDLRLLKPRVRHGTLKKSLPHLGQGTLDRKDEAAALGSCVSS